MVKPDKSEPSVFSAKKLQDFFQKALANLPERSDSTFSRTRQTDIEVCKSIKYKGYGSFHNPYNINIFCFTCDSRESQSAPSVHLYGAQALRE